jgi:hypothetical protein
MIKLISLNGKEQDIVDAHDSAICGIALIPNQGILVSIDESNEVAVRNLKALDEGP